MRAFLFFTISLGLGCCMLSCKKDKGPQVVVAKKPPLNEQEKALLGYWSIDSTSVKDSNSVFISHIIPNLTQTDPRIFFLEQYDCERCEGPYYKGYKGTTPGNLEAMVWNGITIDTLRFGSSATTMVSYRIVSVTASQFALRQAGANKSTSTSYYHRN